jgi:hypothetical protein
MARSKTSAQLLDTAKRRSRVLAYRRAGMTYEQIANQMVEDGREGVFKGSLPSGWDARYAYKDVKRELEKLRDEMAEDVSAIRELEIQRLDEMIRNIWDQVESGELGAYDRVLRIMKRRADLMGLDAPKRTELTGADGEPMKVEMVKIGGIDPEKDI